MGQLAAQEGGMSKTGQVTSNAAEIYDEFLPAALFDQWPPHVLERAGVTAGMRVLDVACGTGVLSIAAAEAVKPNGSVVGLDLNPGMLAVARRKAPQIDWRESSAEALDFDDASFDAVVSQFGLMFFQDKPRAIGEVLRVLRPGGRFAIAVWDSHDRVPGYAALSKLLGRMFGDEAAESLGAPHSLGDTEVLSSLFSAAGAPDVQIETLDGTARYPSIRDWMHVDVRGWTLADQIDDAQFERLVSEAEKELARFVTSDGKVEFSLSAHIAAAIKPAPQP
jgi:ubiquinone/menaquinone biosynthesis C-methylase UbiE